jgi:hypothetical protein
MMFKRRHDVPQATFETNLQDLTSMSGEPSVRVARLNFSR